MRRPERHLKTCCSHDTGDRFDDERDAADELQAKDMTDAKEKRTGCQESEARGGSIEGEKESSGTIQIERSREISQKTVNKIDYACTCRKTSGQTAVGETE